MAARASQILNRQLLGSGANAHIQNILGHSPLMIAAHWGHSDVVNVFLQQPDPGIDQLDKMGKSALSIARSGIPGNY
jgi:ankyrin repeat protein